MKGAPHGLRSPHILADNGLIHEEVLTLFAEIFRGEYRHPMPGDSLLCSACPFLSW